MASDPYKYFRIEAQEIVDSLGKGLLDLEKHADAELVARLLRLAHTLKGAARIVKHRELADLSHALEDALEPLRDAPVAQRLDDAIALLDRMAAQVAALPKPAASEPEEPQTARRAAPEPVSSVPRIDAAAIDDILGGLVEVHALLGRLRVATDPDAIATRLEALDREIRGVRHDVERLRLLPAAAMFTSLERTARDAALASGKRVEVACTGGEVRVDARVFSALHAPLVQLVRNAVAHGIEAAAARTAAGKPPEGRIAIAFALDGDRAIVSCTDDGAGIDHEAVRRAALRRGLPGARELDREQLVELLLRGGISTSADVNEIAGRGIGLDLVHATVRELGGSLTARTAAGAGTSITIAVRASLAAMATLVVEVGGRIVAIPQAAVRRAVRIDESRLVRAPDGTTVSFDDLAIPFAPLAAVLAVAGARGDTMVVVEAAGELAALGVDRTLGVEDVVVRAVPEGVPIDPIVSGIALDGEGHPRPVLEPAALIAAVRAAPVVAPEAPSPRLPILVVDDSLTTRMLEQSILESAGYAVETATSGEEALERLAHRSYRLLLVDVEMPGMDGFTLISQLRARRETADLPAILVTSRNAPEDRRRGAEVGAQGYVVKGEFDQVALLETIRKLVQR